MDGVGSPANSYSVAGVDGTLTVTSNGTYTYTVTSHTSATDTFTLKTIDESGFITNVTLTFNVPAANTNHAPVAVVDVNAVTEDTVAAVSGNVLTNDTDPDASDTHSVTAVNGVAGNVGANMTGTYGTLHLNANGTYTYTLNNALASVQALAQGQQVTDVFSYTNSDNHGASGSSSLTITITGTNDAAVITGTQHGIADRDGCGADRQRHADDQRRRQPGDLRGAGRHRRQLRHLRDRRGRRLDLHRQLGAQRVRRPAPPTPTPSRSPSADGTATSVTINILGTNDAAVLSADARQPDRDQRGGCIAPRGTLTISDVDSPATLRGAGRHRRQLRHLRDRCRRRLDLHRQLGAQRVRRPAPPTPTPSRSPAPTAPRTSVTINILGTNDAAVLSADTANLTETNAAADISTAGTLTISDVDSPATFVAQAGTAGSYGTFAIDAAGAWTYTASSAHNEFVAGTTYTDTFTVASADGTATSVTINILGTNDAAVVVGRDGNLTETDTAAASAPRHADHQRRRQPGDLRGAGRHRRQLRHLRDRRGRRLDLHGQLGARRVRRPAPPTPTRFTVASADGTATRSPSTSSAPTTRR